jgi:hypothetical protein
MLQSCVDKYISRPQELEHISLIEFIANYNMRNKNLTNYRKSKIVQFVHYNKFKDPENWTKEQLSLYVLF